MSDIVGGMSIAETVLWFVLIFILPMIAIILNRLRRYEELYGLLGPKRKKAKGPPKPAPAAPAVSAAPAVPGDVFPYRAAVFLDPSEIDCLGAIGAAMGEGVLVFAKTALSALAESTDANPGYAERLKGLAVDYLVVDAKTGKPFTAIRFEPEKGAPSGARDAVRGVCAAMGLHLVSIPRKGGYDAKELRKLLGIPELDI
ncbi:MAG: DUF2726 domain-containing protein [Planctomycetota bacterium]|jgi:hypothetical protein|nr:DUF2726 domain-containing protein [Planctomycetota bacterium]